MQKKFLIPVGIIILVAAGIFGFMKFRDIFRTNDDTETANEQLSESLPSDDGDKGDESTSFDKTKYSINTPGSIWWVVNKTRPLPAGYTPDDLVVPDIRLRLNASNEQMKISGAVEPALIDMFRAASADGITLVFGSGYRSEALQRQFYNTYVSQDGQAAADRLSARPGTSEHQTGLAFDATSLSGACHLETCFEDTPEGKWLQNNAYRYGFIVRYPRDKEQVTGYSYEPWHLRYVGIELSTEMHDKGVKTLEEFFDLPAAPDYL